MTQPAKYTPGPWVVDEVSEDNAGQTTLGIYADPKAGNAMGYICGIHCAEEVDITDTDLANATLIAAAPAMYEALKMARWLSNECECHESWNAPEGNLCGHCTADLAIKTALSQAEGKQ